MQNKNNRKEEKKGKKRGKERGKGKILVVLFARFDFHRGEFPIGNALLLGDVAKISPNSFSNEKLDFDVLTSFGKEYISP